MRAEPNRLDFAAFPQILKPFVPALARTERSSVELTILNGPPPAPSSSRLGGAPLLEYAGQHPIDPATGAPLDFLALLDLSELPPLPGFPTAGLLQFFVALAADPAEERAAVLYNPTSAGLAVSEAEPSASTFLCNPLQDPAREYALRGELWRLPAPPGSVLADEAIEQTCDELWDDAPDAGRVAEAYREAYQGRGHRLGGHPTRIQSTFSENEGKLLLQLDSEPWRFNDLQHKILWGDLGTGRFFIPEPALQARDFTAVEFEWDNN
jgi:uncharacterized protein YwqG